MLVFLLYANFFFYENLYSIPDVAIWEQERTKKGGKVPY